MARLTWDAIGTRFYETGVDQGVLYVPGLDGVSWQGLTSVKESPSGGANSPFYQDGIKYLNVAMNDRFEATIEAFSAPDEFALCDGTASPYAGLLVTQQPRKAFNFCYRTLVGNDVEGTAHGYKLHLVYNALAKPTSKDNQSIGGSPSPISLSWGIVTTPTAVSGLKPSAYFVLDSRYISEEMMEEIENILYGTSDSPPRMITITEILNLLAGFLPLLLVEIGTTGVYRLMSVGDVTDGRAFIGATPPEIADTSEPFLWLDTSSGEYAVPNMILGD